MPEPLFVVVIVIPVLAVGYVVMKWVARVEQRAQARQEMDRVYYPRRGRKVDIPELKRRPVPGHGTTDG